nr:NAD-dependent epimerase/dehydratase family protein [Pedosphaera parvula]
MNSSSHLPSISRTSQRQKPVLITGGAGFIGTNVAHRFLSKGQPVLIYENLSRPGVQRNLEWLQKTHGDLLEVEIAGIQDADKIRRAARHASKVFHFAAQVAVTSSLLDPVHDFEVNARGTLNLLEGLRSLSTPPPLLFTSTNKVYGDLHDVDLQMRDGRYEPVDPLLRTHGFNESRQLDFHSPYGCSKGCACEYVLDYARTFKMPAVAFHMSCIYGPHQFGNEDQGWVAHFLIQALRNKPITVYGDGRQVRDILFVEDLIDAFLLAHENIGSFSGQAFNIGGSPANTSSLIELLALIKNLQGNEPEVHFDDWRPADQRYYVSDIRKFSSATGWAPKVDVQQGVSRLFHWLKENHPRSTEVLKTSDFPVNRLSKKSDNSRHSFANGTVCTGHKKVPRTKHLYEAGDTHVKCPDRKMEKLL